MAAVQLQHVSKMFGSVTAVDDVSIEIMDHEFTSLLGPSGCGKTTCLRMIAGLEEPSTGEILIGGRDVISIPPKDRDIAMVFQNYALYPHMCVRENMVMGLKFRKVPKEEISDRVGEVAKLLELDELLDRRPAQLSGGQRQRVALGRAIVRNPQVFLMDEPLSNLDTKLRAQMRVELKSLHHRIKTTIIYVTHDQLEAMTMSDRIAVMNEGHVLQLDIPDRIFNEPVDRFVAQFVGSPAMNFLPGILGEENGNPYVHMEDLTLPINGSCAEGLAKRLSGRDVEIGLRPHAVGLTPNAEEGLAVGEIFVVEPLGTHTHVHVKLGSRDLVAVADAGFTGGVRDSVGIRFQRQDVYLFDPASGKTLAHGI